MDDTLQSLIEQHSAGEIIKHAGPYSDLKIPSSKKYPSQEFARKWVLPFYQKVDGNPQDFIQAYAPLREDIDQKIIANLLVCLDWRSRSVGACFAAIEQMTHFTEHIGRLLLRSEVCYAGVEYTLALARFNSVKSRKFLNQYLEYYLTQPKLIFDQAFVMAAVAYLDQINESDELTNFSQQWKIFCAQTETSLDIRIRYFIQRMNWIGIASNSTT